MKRILFSMGFFIIIFASSCLGCYFFTEGVDSQNIEIAILWGLSGGLGSFAGYSSKQKAKNRN